MGGARMTVLALAVCAAAFPQSTSLAAPSPRRQADARAGIGMIKPFPKAYARGPRIEFELWTWGEDESSRRKLFTLTDGARVEWAKLPPAGLQARFRAPFPHDTASMRLRSSDGVDSFGWGPEKITRTEPVAERLYRLGPPQWSLFPNVGTYLLEAEVWRDGRSVAAAGVSFEIVAGTEPPRNTRYFAGKRDSRGTPVTCSRPVDLGALNESPVLKDTDYPFEPQRAVNVVNFERFPPFRMNPKFILIWNTRRFTDEAEFGGPLDRGFNMMATIMNGQDNLRVDERVWFITPDTMKPFCQKWYEEDPKKYADLKAWIDYWSAFVSSENAYRLGRETYKSWGGGGYAPYDAGIFGFDEEFMWDTIGEKVRERNPELLPEHVRALLAKDPEAKDPHTQHVIRQAYKDAWGRFIGDVYRGAKDCAAERGRRIRIYHYGSLALGFAHSLWHNQQPMVNPATGKNRQEELSALEPWYQKDGKVDFSATEFVRQVDYFHKDFYYHTLFPEKATMYEKDSGGRYVLGPDGRRRIRKDVFEETLYDAPVKIGHEDCQVAPVFLTDFISKGESALYWLNGGRYYRRSDTLVTDKGFLPTLRRGNQETWGESGKLGSRPVCPFMAEASAIFPFLIGTHGIYLWDAMGFTAPAGEGRADRSAAAVPMGEIESIVKGLHRLSKFNSLFDGAYSFVRPVRYPDVWNRDHPLIRGIIKDRYLLLGMANPYLDPGEEQRVELWYDAPYEARARAVWRGEVTILGRRTHLFQCRLPALPRGREYDPDRLYLRYTLVDGNHTRTFIVTGNYDVPYPHGG